MTIDRISRNLPDVNNVNKKVVLYIDGLIVRIQRPDNAGNAYFCGRNDKSCDSLNVQYLVDINGFIRHVISGISGATHDKTAAEWSPELMNFLENLPEGYVVLGDPAYRNLHDRVMHTFVGRGLDDAQLAYNDRAKRLRQIVERAIGATEIKWKMDQFN